jgi:hypothetical protein
MELVNKEEEKDENFRLNWLRFIYLADLSGRYKKYDQQYNSMDMNAMVDQKDDAIFILERLHMELFDHLYKSGKGVSLGKLQATEGSKTLLDKIDRVIEECLVNEGKESFQVDIASIGFEKSLDPGIVSGRRFFGKLKEEGCFKGGEPADNTHYQIEGCDVEKLKLYKAKVNEAFVSQNGNPKKANELRQLIKSDKMVSLDHDIVMVGPFNEKRRNFIYYHDGKIWQGKSIPPKLAYAFNHLYVIRKQDDRGRSRNIKQLAEKIGCKIATLKPYRSNFDKFWTETGLKKIIVTVPSEQDKWALNQNLSCCSGC